VIGETDTGSRTLSPGDDAGLSVVDEYVQGTAAPALRPYVAWYSGYRQRGVPPNLHRGLPSPYLTLIFTLDEPLSILGHPDPRQPPGDFDALLGGLHATPALITHDGAQSGVQAELSPLGARALLGLPAGELAHIDVSADAVLGAVCDEVRDRLRTATTWRARFAAVDEGLLRAARSDREVAPEVTWAWRRLRRSRGTVSASSLAAEVGWSGRHLAHRFQVEVGLSPKAAARVIRFDHARRLLAARAPDLPGPLGFLGSPDAAEPFGPGLPAPAPGPAGTGPRAGGGLADLAAECGYFDQAHLAREFRALAGCPPSRWLAELRNVQAPGGACAEG
jgi:AraC-like DNA-binding protein